jgi:hypothetical protein
VIGGIRDAAGHGWGLAVFPLLAAAIALVFAVRLTQRYLGRRRSYEGIWAVALFMYAAASFAMFLGVITGWTATEFRVYWLLGAVLNVPYLFLGEVYLLGRLGWRASAVAVGVTVLMTAFVVIEVWQASMHPTALARALPLGREVFGDGTLAYRLAQYIALPAYFLLLAGLVWSTLQMRGNPELRNRMTGTFGIAMGATIVAIGSGIGAAFHVVPLFSVSLAAGIAVMFWGFVQATRPAVKKATESPVTS